MYNKVDSFLDHSQQSGSHAGWTELISKMHLAPLFNSMSCPKHLKTMRQSQEAVDSVLDIVFAKCHSKLYETYLFSFVPQKMLDFQACLNREVFDMRELHYDTNGNDSPLIDDEPRRPEKETWFRNNVRTQRKVSAETRKGINRRHTEHGRSGDIKVRTKQLGTSQSGTTPLLVRHKTSREKMQSTDYGPFYIKTSENENDQFEQKLRQQKEWEEKMKLVREQKEEEKRLAEEQREENREKMLSEKGNRLIANYTHEGVLSTLHPVKTEKLPPHCSQVNFSVHGPKEVVQPTKKSRQSSYRRTYSKQQTRRRDDSEEVLLVIPQMSSMYDHIQPMQGCTFTEGMRRKIGPYLDDSISNIQQILNETVFNATMESRKQSQDNPPVVPNQVLRNSTLKKANLSLKMRELVKEQAIKIDTLKGHKNVRLSRNAYSKITRPGNLSRGKSGVPMPIQEQEEEMPLVSPLKTQHSTTLKSVSLQKQKLLGRSKEKKNGQNIIINSTKNLDILFSQEEKGAGSMAKLPRIQVNESQEEQQRASSVDKFNQQLICQSDWGKTSNQLNYTPKGIPVGSLQKPNEKVLMMKSAHAWKLPRERDLYKGGSAQKRP